MMAGNAIVCELVLCILVLCTACDMAVVEATEDAAARNELDVPGTTEQYKYIANSEGRGQLQMQETVATPRPSHLDRAIVDDSIPSIVQATTPDKHTPQSSAGTPGSSLIRTVACDLRSTGTREVQHVREAGGVVKSDLWAPSQNEPASARNNVGEASKGVVYSENKNINITNINRSGNVFESVSVKEEDPLVSAQDFSAIRQGRLCFDFLRPVAYFCVFPRPSWDWGSI